MKTRFITALVIVSSLFIGCKNDKKENITDESIKEQVIEDAFKVTLDVLVKKDDNFQLYFTDKKSEDFNEKESIWIEVKGMDAPQKVVFTLPKDVLPTLFRLDFGLNNEQEDIVLSVVEIDYFGKKFSAKGITLANYFRPVDLTNINFETGVIKPIMKDGKRVEPVLYPQEVPLAEEINKLVK